MKNLLFVIFMLIGMIGMAKESVSTDVVNFGTEIAINVIKIDNGTNVTQSEEDLGCQTRKCVEIGGESYCTEWRDCTTAEKEKMNP